MAVLEILRDSRAYIAGVKDDELVRLTYAVDAEGRPVVPQDPTAVRWSGFGAIYRGRALHSIERAAARLELEYDLPATVNGRSLVVYCETASVAELVALFDRTIARLEATLATGAP